MNKIHRLFRYDWPLHFVLLSTNWLPDNVVFLRFRGWLAHFFFRKCGKDLRLGRNCVFYNSSNIEIGNNVYIAYGNWFSAGAYITIKDFVIFGPKSIVTSSNHTFQGNSYRYGIPELDTILIEEGCWIAANCTIPAGKNIGKGCLVGANSVVTKNVPDRVLFAGNPGRIIKKLE